MQSFQCVLTLADHNAEVQITALHAIPLSWSAPVPAPYSVALCLLHLLPPFLPLSQSPSLSVSCCSLGVSLPSNRSWLQLERSVSAKVCE